MPEQQYPDYKLQPEVFQAWLRKRFSDSSIEVKCRHGNFVFNLPDNEEINDNDHLEIRKLRGKSTLP
ncbi:hypothetical protein FOPG_17225 [Fusarium oxysporum f. sp. conglutinans race 2 54008]|uniref:Uncharacterized protein n=1 Tax=Fusarium oxysporum f. sp. conglutinans race 2 54008 TaxID=1089457 RepID=X0HZU7_FUSOX|nr:hypothetical protein FOPG_17225 [Fusarium oxysporum f. sp. conglutinans race 2 54008]